MYQENISDLSDEQKSQFKNLLLEFPDVFSKDDFDLGCLKGVEHKINTYDEIPVSGYSTPIPKTRAGIH